MAGMGLFTGGFLVAIGYGVIVLSVLVAGLIVFATVAFVAAWPELQRLLGAGVTRLRPRIVTGVGNAATASRRGSAFATHAVATLPRLATQARLRAAPRVRGAYRSCVRAGASANRWATQTAQGTGARLASRARQTDPRRDALQLNAAGAQYRRNGQYDHAVDCHRRALEIFGTIDDRKAVALTQSNLALALSHAGDDKWAIGLFEEAAKTLRDLGDEQHEAQIIANLGLAHRRHGRREEGDNVLELALSKLPPASSEYQAIEAELRRAS